MMILLLLMMEVAQSMMNAVSAVVMALLLARAIAMGLYPLKDMTVLENV
jgi:hypothetical protein